MAASDVPYELSMYRLRKAAGMSADDVRRLLDPHGVLYLRGRNWYVKSSDIGDTEPGLHSRVCQYFGKNPRS